MNDKQRRALSESLEEFGDILPLVVRKIEGEKYQIIDGQHRFEALQDAEIDCIIIEASDTEAKRLTQILNRTRGEDNPEKLKELIENLLQEISLEELIKGWAYDSKEELDSLLAELSTSQATIDLDDIEDGFPEDEPPDNRPADAAFTLGFYRFKIPREDYDLWESQIREKVGFQTEEIEAEIKKRLGL